MKALEHKIPPPVVGLLMGAGMWGLARITPLVDTPFDTRPVAACIALVGLAFDVAGIVSFRLARTTVNPLKPQKASALVTSGVYRITRNPMYVGMLCLLAVWAVYLRSGWALVGPIAFVLYMNRFQIGPEERALREIFGDTFDRYKAGVRRWL